MGIQVCIYINVMYVHRIQNTNQTSIGRVMIKNN